jgi:transcriptional regulator GlxA family with amidase domain
LILASDRHYTRGMHRVSILAQHGLVPSDLATPLDIPRRVVTPAGRACYDVRICGEAPLVVAEGFDLRAPFSLDDLSAANTVIVPGIADLFAPLSSDVVSALLEARARGARMVSICTGAFVLAATGMLDGLRATTHWRASVSSRPPRCANDSPGSSA